MLHYATWADSLPKGTAIYTVRLVYADGREQRIPIRNKLEIGDWWQAPAYPNAFIVFAEEKKAIFLTCLELPETRVPVRELCFESAGGADPFILALTGEAAD